ncbi:hypothetical protein BUALT_Bualt18G0070700 [Buddleja alternifolia]|uniref:PHD finger protein n=1 Tax=Buddleja alternifolia TaxID=168488 RepID=A0AAV6W3X6_9LAMI|nr:hypothetical protein BUALT_Bualt18G0070700 [Buddleja alternifolia]
MEVQGSPFVPMESTVEIEIESSAARLGHTRPATEDGLVLEEALPIKRGKFNGDLIGDVKKVAEIVLVLAAMGKMRGGRGPTAAEKDLMSEARSSLTKVCEGFAPEDVFPRDGFGGVIEDLGLNKLREQRVGFRPPKVSIAEKFLVSKRKMEKAEDFLLYSTPHISQRLQGNSGAAIESHSELHPVRLSQSNKSSSMPVSSGRFQSASPLGHGTTANSSPLPYQLPTSEIRPVISNALPSSHFVSSALPRVDRPDNGRSTSSSQASQAQANYSNNSSLRTPTWSMQTQSVSSVKIASDNKVQAPGGNTHAEIGKIVQKLLQPNVAEQRTWIPPSREYMNKALTCQMCMSSVTEIDSILICDACEKGYHLKCLQSTYPKGVPRGEWHCGKCLLSSSGKPLPPKYGRVMRNMDTSKVCSIKKDGASNEKVSQLEVTVNGNTSMQSVPTRAVGNTYGHQVSQSKREVAEGVHMSNNIPSWVQMDDKVSFGTCLDNLIKTSNSAFASAANSAIDKMCDEKMVELKANPMEKLEMVCSSPDKSLAMVNAQDGKQPLENLVETDSRESHIDEILNYNSNLQKDGLHAVNWIGDPVQVLDEKSYYASCRINGHLYKVKNHVLIRSDGNKLVPSKLQAMWEDNNSLAKWVTVNRCYFPGDLPEAVGHPCSLESCEVYESICGTTLMAGLIESPCEVLPPRKFAEERENRSRSGTQLNDHLPPIYLCKWIYDEPKGLFRDISF